MGLVDATITVQRSNLASRKSIQDVLLGINGNAFVPCLFMASSSSIAFYGLSSGCASVLLEFGQ